MQAYDLNTARRFYYEAQIAEFNGNQWLMRSTTAAPGAPLTTPEPVARDNRRSGVRLNVKDVLNQVKSPQDNRWKGVRDLKSSGRLEWKHMNVRDVLNLISGEKQA